MPPLRFCTLPWPPLGPPRPAVIARSTLRTAASSPRSVSGLGLSLSSEPDASSTSDSDSSTAAAAALAAAACFSSPRGRFFCCLASAADLCAFGPQKNLSAAAGPAQQQRCLSAAVVCCLASAACLCTSGQQKTHERLKGLVIQGYHGRPAQQG